MLVRRVRIDLVNNDPEAARMSSGDQCLEVVKRAEAGVDAAIIGNVVAGIEHGRGEDRRQPQRLDPQIGQVVEPSG